MRIVLLFLFAVIPGPATAADVEIVCVDGSKLRAKLLDETIEVKTKYGTLTIPAADVQRITFAMRLTPAEAKRIDDLITGMGSTDFEMREKATTELREMRERAYPALLKASKHADAEIGRRATESMKWLEMRVPGDTLRQPTVDTIHVEGSVIRGTLAATSLRVKTAMFGEQTLRLSDVRRLDAVAGPK